MKVKEILKKNVVSSIQPLVSLSLGMFFPVELTASFGNVLRHPRPLSFDQHRDRT